jgi:photosystem I 4.8kDa protein
MTAKTSKSTKTSKPNYTFRASWAALLLGINFLVAAYYFHLLT